MSETKAGRIRQKKSILWNFFTGVTDSVATCDICHHRISHRSTTNNLRKHILRKHPNIGLTPPNPTKWQRIAMDDGDIPNSIQMNTSTLSANGKSPPDSKPVNGFFPNIDHAVLSPAGCSTPKIDDKHSNDIHGRTLYKLKSGKFYTKLMGLLTQDFHPYRIVEDKGFREFVSFLSPTYHLPSKSYISKCAIPELYKKCLAASRELIKTGDIFCITIEMWTSVNADSFLSVTAHFVNDEFKLNSLLLDCVTIGFERNSENFAYEIKRIVNDWGIEEKIQFAVSENDIDIQNAISALLGYEHFNCFADSLNTIVRESIENAAILKVIEKVSSSVAYFKRNIDLYERLKSSQKQMNDEANVGLVQLSDMRCFRSIYFMLDRYTKLESTIKSLLDSNHEVLLLTEEEWKMAHQMCLVLKPFESVVQTISTETYCPASLVIPVVNGLYSVCDNLLKKSFLAPVKATIADLKETITNTLGNIETSATLSVCTFLDPRFKNLAFSSKALANHAKEVVLSALTSASDDKPDSAVPQEENVEEELTVWHVFDQAVAENRSNLERTESKHVDDELSVWSNFDNTVALSRPKLTASSQALAEIQRYLDSDMLPRQENPLQWWRDNRQFYPQLSALARSQLCAVSTSVPCDRSFTKSGFILNERRSKLNEKNTKMLVFLNANL